jgi:hypothetical protein
MIMQSLVSRYPGTRIDGYRNSTPRLIKLIAVGPKAERLIADIIDRDRTNVLDSGVIEPDRIIAMDEPVDGIRPHAVIVVHDDGDADSFPFRIERTASMLSFIVLEDWAPGREAAATSMMRELRAVADLFVTTSDRDFVRELVDNLAS